MAEKYKLLSQFGGYFTKLDKTNIKEDKIYLVSPSQNVLVNDGEKVATRGGYTLLGAANTATTGIESSYVWVTSSGDEIPLRGYDDELEFYVGTVDSIAFNAWYRLKASWSAVDFQFAPWWDTTPNFDLLLFVVGDDNIYDWTGAITTLKSATANTITKNGTTTWAQERFSTAGTRKVIINGTEYTYTGGENTTTLTGVTPDPSAEAANSLVYQTVRTNADQPAANAVNDVIAVLENHVFLGNLALKEVSVSANDDFTDYTFSTPRVPGEGELLVLDSPTVGFISQEREMWITAGKDDWYVTQFEQLDVGSTLTETLKVRKLKTGPQQAAISQNLITKIKTGVVYVSNELSLDVLANIENPVAVPLSDPIKPDFDDETFAGGHAIFYKGSIYVSAPANSKAFIYDVIRKYWQPPQVLPVNFFFIYGGDLYGHSANNPETYKLFDGTNDNAKSFKATAAFSYRSYGPRFAYKNIDEWATEGYTSSNTELILTLNFDYGGFTQSLQKTISGRDERILFESLEGGSLGVSPLGDASLGDSESEMSVLSKFKVIHTFPKQDFFEIQAIYETDDVDRQWQILAFGGNAEFSKNMPITIKQ